ncbi:hypothetical protein OIU77_024807 [Salix suchowensis]|uniref:pyridoxal 5'-phosphate synthase n=1 Tax=Salix suchowensis TaxID=1278906 RepID=A0ABQ9BU01_9ROSI|nr:hypothetical protein OIU77_024807 [Salix suchowensis]
MEAASSKGDRVKLSPQATIDLMADLPIAPSFSENSDRIQINTDFRTRKIEELNHCPFAEICWYFSDYWEHSGSMEELKLSMGPIPIRKSFSKERNSGLVTTFCLLVLEPDQVDYLNLKSNHRIVPPCHRVPMEKCVGI